VFVDFGIQHAMLMRCIILASVACLALQHCPTLPIKRHDFEKCYWA